jgi:hypothetical protein
VAQQAAVERAKSVHSEAGGPTDPYLDVTMARFCMENDWNDEKTHAQIRKAVAFRTSNNAAEYRKALLGGRRLVEFERWQQAGTVLPALPYIGTTWHGDPMQLSGPGGIDVERLLATISLDDFFDFNLLVLEFNSLNIDKLTLARADGTLVRMVMIINAAGVTFAHLKLMKYTRLVAPLADAYYPEFIASATSFNVNPVIYVGYNMLRPLLSGLRLMIELGTSADADLALLTSRVRPSARAAKMQKKVQLHMALDVPSIAPPEHLPACYGGSLLQLSPAVRSVLGTDHISEPLLSRLFPGPTKYAGGLHLPPARALERDEEDERRPRGRRSRSETPHE